MRETLLVLRREFLERVRTKAFIIGTIAFPLFMIAVMVIPAVLGAGRGERNIVLVDETPGALGEQVAAVLTAEAPAAAEEGEQRETRNTYRVERVARPLGEVQAELNRRVQEKEIDGYLHLPADILESSEMTYRGRNISNFDMLGEMRRAATSVVQGARLQRAGLAPGDVARLVMPVRVETARVTARGEEAGSAESAFFLSYGIGFLVYMLIILYGANVQRSVLEEKTNRISEVIVSSMRADHLMMGKIVGVAAVALLQVSVWAAVLVFATWPQGPLARVLPLSPTTLSILQLPLPVGLTVVAYFVLGFLLYASLYAALGAAVTTEQEAQQLQWVVLLPLFVPLLLVFRIATDPLGPEATVLGLIPFTSPMTMPMRVVGTEVPASQVLGGLGLLLVSVLALAWIAGKIYRVGILSTGKKPSLKELARWVRAA